ARSPPNWRSGTSYREFPPSLPGGRRSTPSSRCPRITSWPPWWEPSARSRRGHLHIYRNSARSTRSPAAASEFSIGDCSTSPSVAFPPRRLWPTDAGLEGRDVHIELTGLLLVPDSHGAASHAVTLITVATTANLRDRRICA